MSVSYLSAFFAFVCIHYTLHALSFAYGYVYGYESNSYRHLRIKQIHIIEERRRKALRHTIVPQRRASNAQLRRNNAYLMNNLDTYALVLDVVNLEYF
jgi:hypothetical protein